VLSHEGVSEGSHEGMAMGHQTLRNQPGSEESQGDDGQCIVANEKLRFFFRMNQMKLEMLLSEELTSAHGPLTP
jgi:hypothetical protein